MHLRAKIGDLKKSRTQDTQIWGPGADQTGIVPLIHSRLNIHISIHRYRSIGKNIQKCVKMHQNVSKKVIKN